MIILASASPRRQELLKMIFTDFSVLPANIDETVEDGIDLLSYPKYLAVKKAGHIHKEHYDDLVIGSDTGVFIDDEMLGKPENYDDAVNMLKRLSGRSHKVITGCAVFYKDKTISFSQTTEVEFYPLSDKEIEDYVKTNEPMDKAGAYGIQGLGAMLVKGIKGDFYNVIGLPVAQLKSELAKLEIF